MKMVLKKCLAFVAACSLSLAAQPAQRQELFAEAYFEAFANNAAIARSVQYNDKSSAFMIGKNATWKRFRTKAEYVDPLFNLVLGGTIGVFSSLIAYEGLGSKGVTPEVLIPAAGEAVTAYLLYKSVNAFYRGSSFEDCILCTHQGFILPRVGILKWEGLANVSVVNPATSKEVTSKIKFELNGGDTLEWNAFPKELAEPLAIFMNSMVAKVKSEESRVDSRLMAFTSAYSHAFLDPEAESVVERCFQPPLNEKVFFIRSVQPFYAQRVTHGWLSLLGAATCAYMASTTRGGYEFAGFGVSSVALAVVAGVKFFRNIMPDGIFCSPIGFFVKGQSLCKWSDVQSVELVEGLDKELLSVRIVFHLKNGSLVRWDKCPHEAAGAFHTFVKTLMGNDSAVAAPVVA